MEITAFSECFLVGEISEVTAHTKFPGMESLKRNILGVELGWFFRLGTDDSEYWVLP